MSGEERTAGPYRVSSAKAGKARAVARHWVVGPNFRAGHFASAEVAQQEADRLNAALPECTCAARDMPFGRCCKAVQEVAHG